MTYIINPYAYGAGGGGGGSGEFSYITTIDDVSTVNGSVARTFSSVSFGDADANREIVVVFSSRTSFLSSVSAFTIGGVSATSVVGIGGIAGQQIAMYRANVPTGTSGDIAITLNQSSSDGTIHVYRVVPAVSSTPVDSGGVFNQSTDTVTVSDIEVADGGFLIVGAITAFGVTSTAPSYNGTDTPIENYDASVNSRWRASWSCETTENASTNDPGITKSPSGAALICVVAASWN